MNLPLNTNLTGKVAVVTGAAGSVSADSSLKTSQIRLTDSADMVSIT